MESQTEAIPLCVSAVKSTCQVQWHASPFSVRYSSHSLKLGKKLYEGISAFM